MKNSEVLDKFNVEELEQRYEMGKWVESVRFGYNDRKVDIGVIFET